MSLLQILVQWYGDVDDGDSNVWTAVVHREIRQNSVIPEQFGTVILLPGLPKHHIVTPVAYAQLVCHPRRPQPPIAGRTACSFSLALPCPEWLSCRVLLLERTHHV